MMRRYVTQEAVLEYIADYKRDPANDGNSPTYKEIAEATGRNVGNVYRCCLSLARKRVIDINHRGKLVLPGGRYIPPE